MSKIVKKAMAAALALTLVGGGLPAITGCTDIFKPSIVANAGSNVKKIGVGVTLNFGETFDGTINDYGNACCAFDYINNPTTYNEQTFNGDGFDSWTSLCTRYDNDRQMWLICDARPSTVGYVYGGLNPIAGRNFEEPVGIKVISGDGTGSAPFQFELVYEGEPKSLQDDVTIGKKWYIGDEISTDAYFSTKIGLVNTLQYSYYLDSENALQTYNWLGTSSNKVIHLKNTTLSAGDFYVLNNGNAYLCFNDVSTGIFSDYEDGFERRFTKELGFEVPANSISNLNYTGSGASSDPFIFTAGSMDGTAENIIGIEIVGGSGTEADPFTLAPIYSKNTIKGASLTLDDDIGVNFYAYVSYEAEKAVLSGPNGDVTINKTDFDVQADGSVKLTYPINATQTESTIKLKLYGASNKHLDIYNSNNEKDADGVIEFSAQTYFDNAAPDSSWSEEKKSAFTNLVIATQNYADISEAYFNDGTVAAITDEQVNEVVANTYESSFTTDEAKISLVLDSKLAARIYIKDKTVEAGAAAEYTQYSSDTSPWYDITAKSGGKAGVYFEIPGLAPTELHVAYRVKYDGKYYNFSPLTWARRVMNNPNSTDKSKAMAYALYQYYVTARDFKYADEV